VLKQAEGTSDAAVAEDVQRKYAVRDDMEKETDDCKVRLFSVHRNPRGN